MEILKRIILFRYWRISLSGFRKLIVLLSVFGFLGCERIPEWEQQAASVEEAARSDRLQHLGRWLWTCRGKVKNYRAPQTQALLGLQLNNFLDQFQEGGMGIIDEVSEKTLMGTSVLWSADGHLLTLSRWTDAVTEVECRNAESPWIVASRVGQDPPLGLSLLKVDLSQSKQIFTPESRWVKRDLDDLSIREPLFVVGRGAPGVFDRQRVFLQATRPKLKTGLDEDLVLFLPTPSAVLEGGLLIDNEARVLGYLFLESDSAWGVALSAVRIEDLVSRLISQGKVERPYLGFRVRFEPKKGFVINQVDVGSPAHQAGLRVGHVLDTWNQTELRQPQDWQDIGFEEIGKTVPFSYRHDGLTTETQLTIGSSE